MAFKATNIIPQEAYKIVKSAATNVRRNCLTYVGQLAAGPAGYDKLREIYTFLKNADTQFNELRVTPGLAEYASIQENNPSYDVAVEFAAMQSAIAAVLTWMDSNVPTNVTAKLPSQWIDGQTQIATTFSVAQTAAFRTLLQAAADSVE